jgi:hypothetical protein
MTDPEEKSEQGGLWPDEALVRPTIEVHDESAGAATRIVTPPPNVFSHEVVEEEHVGPTTGPTDVLSVGTLVLLMAVHGDRCWVVDGAGRQVEVSRSSLRALPNEAPSGEGQAGGDRHPPS